MSPSSPSDLATAFRSFSRRLGEGIGALETDPDAQAAAEPHADQVRSAVASAAALLGSATSGDLGATGAALADRIANTEPERWDDATLARLRSLALEAGAALRAIDALAP